MLITFVFLLEYWKGGDMKFPTWEELQIPFDLIYEIKKAQPCYFIDSLIHQMIFREKRKFFYSYECLQCSEIYPTEKESEEIGCCENCESRMLKTNKIEYKFSKKVVEFSRKPYELDSLFNMMQKNYLYYFNEAPKENFFDCGWEGPYPYARFCNGEKIVDNNIRIVIIKSAILCPFLWDDRFNWQEPKDANKVKVNHFTPIIGNLISSTKKEK